MTWDLTKLYASFDAPEFAADMKELKELADEAVEQARGMAIGVPALEEAIRLSERVATLATKTMSFAQLTLAADANCEPAMAAYARLLPVMNRLEEASSALSAKLGTVEDLDALIAQSELLTAHAFLLKKYKQNAAHVIDPVLEPVVLKMQMTGGNAWEQLRDQLDANHMVEIELDGEKKSLPLSAVRGMANSPDAAVRKAAYEAEIAAYPKMEIPMAACLNGIKGEARTLCELKHFDTVLDMALDISNMDRATLDVLLQAMEESLPMFRRYLRLKAKMLGYEGGLKFYDLFAPVGKAQGDYTPEDAHALLVKEFGAFSPRMASMMDRAFNERWIDMFPREGKSGGAFCSGMHPLGISYVLTNFEGSYGSVSTLAHELGHAYHNECMRDVPILMADYPMPLAETASIFNETLLAERMLEKADREAKIAMLEQQLSDAAQVIVDIMSRFLFEKEVSHYYSTQVHFYNFPYAFGQLFAVGVYALYQKKGADFLPDYEKLLRMAGSGTVREVAASVGIDVADVNFWRTSLKVFEDKLARLEKLAGE